MLHSYRVMTLITHEVFSRVPSPTPSKELPSSAAMLKACVCSQVCIIALAHLVHLMQMREAAADRAVQHHIRVVGIAGPEPDLEPRAGRT